MSAEHLIGELVELVAQRAAELVLEQIGSQPAASAVPAVSELMTVPEVAALLRCRRGRVDDLLSAGRLTRVKEGSRTLVRRSEVVAYLAGEWTGIAHVLPSTSRGGMVGRVAR